MHLRALVYGYMSMRNKLLWRVLALCSLLHFGLAGGCKARPHSVALTWQAPRAAAGSTIVSYNLYRSTTSGGPYVKLASGIREPKYEDRMVNRGRTYFYVVTGVDQAGHESKFSDETRAVIP